MELRQRLVRVARAEAELRDSQRRLTETQELARLGTWELDIEDQRITWSDVTFRIAGLDPRAGPPSLADYRRSLHPEDLPLLDHALEEAITLGKPYEVGLRHRRPDGSYNWTLTRARPVLRDGSVVRLVGSVVDMTEMYETQEQLRIFSGAVEQGASALVITDLQGRIEYVNPAYATITGYDADETLGHVPAFLRAEEDAHPKHTELWATIASGQTWQGELLNECKGGEKRWVDVTIWPVKNSFGTPSRYAAILEDIHEHRRIRKELELQRSRMNYAFDAANDGIYDVDLTRMEAYLSPRFFAMLGYRPNEFPSTFETMLELMHPEDRDGFESVLSRVFEGERSRFDIEFRLRSKQGPWFWVRSRGKIVEVDERGKPSRLIGTHLDINDNKRFERELEAAKTKAEAANQAKSRFLANMSHELRTPLNSILGFTRQMDRDPSFPKEHRHSLSVVNRAGEHLLELINDVLEMSKIEVGRLTSSPSTFDLRAMLESVELMMRQRAESKQLRFVLDVARDVPHFVETDQRKLRQVLINLLGNAIKFTDMGTVSIRVHPQGDRGGAVDLRFEVQDTGPGIDSGDRERIFEPFAQSDTPAGAEGTGLGLTISRRFVQVLGGDIQLDSEVGWGSCFHFTIPVGRVTPSAAPPGPRSRRIARLVDNHHPVDGEICRILVVDDNDDNRSFLRVLLQEVGFDVVESSSGSDAVRRCEHEPPHAVLMDLRMPGLNGYDTTRRIKASPSGRRIPVIAISASAFEDGPTHAREAGCDDFVRKPFREAELFDVLARHLHVQFAYQRAEENGRQPDLVEAGSRLGGLPGELREAFVEAARLSDVAGVAELLERIRAKDEALAQILDPYVQDFAHDEIVALFAAIEDERA